MKKHISLALVLALVLTLLSACGGEAASAGTTPGGANSTAPTTTAPATTAAPATTTAPAFVEGVWPDHPHTQQVPKPDMTVGKVNDEFLIMGILEIHFTDPSYADMKAYIDTLKAEGFDRGENVAMDSESSGSIVWNAANADGWLVRANLSSGQGSIQIQRP